MRKILLLFFVLSFSYQAFSQTGIQKIFNEIKLNDDTTFHLKKRKTLIGEYIDFLKIDSRNQTTMFFGSVNYFSVPSSKAITVGGFYVVGGINVARFFSKKIHLGLSFDFNGFKMLIGKKFSSNFKEDFKNGFHLTSNNTHDDSTKSNLLAGALLNPNQNNYLFGSYLGGIGISFSPFPYNYGGITFEYKTGSYSMPVYQAIGMIFGKKEYSEDYIDWSVNYSTYSLFFKPILFSKKMINNAPGLGLCTVGIFYQTVNFSNSNIFDLPLSNFMSKSFLDKYQNTHLLGIKIGYGFW